MTLPRLTHVRGDGTAHMVDISAKAVTAREASAAGRVLLSSAAVAALRDGTVPKGDALAVARAIARSPRPRRTTTQPTTTPPRRTTHPGVAVPAMPSASACCCCH